MLNARISSRSYPRYLFFKRFYALVFGCVHKVLAQSKEDKERLEVLGASCVQVSGNIKLLNKPCISHKFKAPKRPLVVLASTHKGEEELLFSVLNSKPLEFSLLVVPRHPERFDEVWALCHKYFGDYCLKRRSKDLDFLQGEVILGDSMGEMLEFYAISSVVVLCGSFLPIGGHNPLEVAHFNKPLLTGAEIFNQRALFDAIEGYSIIDVQDLPQRLTQPLSPTQIKTQMSREELSQILFER